MRSTVVLAADRFEDPENARIILLAAGGLVLVAVLVTVGTFWWWRTSKVEHPALGPLEVMGSRSFTKGDYTSRRRRLEAARPDGAEPIDATVAPIVEPVDLRAASSGVPPQFDDLAGAFAAEKSDVGEKGADGAKPSDDLAALVAAVPAVAPAAAAGDGADEGVAADVHADIDELVGAVAPAEAAAAPAEALDVPVEEEADPTSVSAEVPRPIDPLLRLQSE